MDSRYRLVDSASTREDWFRDYVRILKEERKRDKEKEKDHRHRDKGDGHHKSEKNKDKERIKESSDNYKSSKDKSSKDKDKDGTREKKHKKGEILTEENGKDPKKEIVVEVEIGEIDDVEDKTIKKENDVSFYLRFYYDALFRGLLKLQIFTLQIMYL